MLDIWDEHGPPSFVTLSAAHLKKKTKSKKAPSSKTPVGEEKDVGTMADLAARFGLGGKKKKVSL